MPMVMLSGTFMLATPQPSTPNIRDDGAPEKGGREPIAESFRGQGLLKRSLQLSSTSSCSAHGWLQECELRQGPERLESPDYVATEEASAPDRPRCTARRSLHEVPRALENNLDRNQGDLEELGCTVYNPNTDNKARSGATNNG